MSTTSPWRPRARKILVRVSILTVWAYAAAGFGAGAAEKEEGIRLIGPYCGVNCVYALSVLYQRPGDYAALLNAHLTSQEGSTMQELVAALGDVSLRGLPLERMSTLDLRFLGHPAILHVKKDAAKKKYDHYEIFLGVEDGEALLFDPPKRPRRESLGAVAARWSGRAIVVSRAPVSSLRACLPSRLAFVFAVAAIVGGMVLLRRLPLDERLAAIQAGRGGLLRRHAIEAGVILCASLCAAWILSSVPGGPLGDGGAIASIRDDKFETFVPKIDAGEMAEASARKSLIVDARLPADYKRGHVPGAINIPVDSSPDAIRGALDGRQKNEAILLYCQSAQCPYAGMVAREIYDLGYRDLSLYKEGWVGWTQKRNP